MFGSESFVLLVAVVLHRIGARSGDPESLCVWDLAELLKRYGPEWQIASGSNRDGEVADVILRGEAGVRPRIQDR